MTWLSVLHRIIPDISAVVVLLFGASSSTGRYVGARSVRCRRVSEKCQISPDVVVDVHRRVLLTASQGTSIHYLHISAAECCRCSVLSPIVSF